MHTSTSLVERIRGQCKHLAGGEDWGGGGGGESTSTNMFG